MDRGHSLTRILLSSVGTVDVGKARLMFWDLGGQEELQSLWDKVRRMHRPPASRHFPPGGTLIQSPLFTEGLRLTFTSCQQLCHPLCS